MFTAKVNLIIWITEGILLFVVFIVIVCDIISLYSIHNCLKIFLKIKREKIATYTYTHTHTFYVYKVTKKWYGMS